MGEINVLGPGSPPRRNAQGPTESQVGFRPESAQLTGEGIAAVVKQATYLGSKTQLLVETETGETLKIWTRENARPGESLHFHVKPEGLILL